LNNNLTELEKAIVASIQGDMAIDRQPYLKIAEKLGVAESTLLESLQKLCDRGVIRRFGATLRHQKSGFTANAMVAWQVEEVRMEKVGQTMASFPQVSHCYRRNPSNGWPYNLYTMVHASDKDTCRQIAQEMAKASQVSLYTVLFSHKELKKTSMRYFPEKLD
jgi:DNA-binding Lrp family transcriptional regulator